MRDNPLRRFWHTLANWCSFEWASIRLWLSPSAAPPRGASRDPRRAISYGHAAIGCMDQRACCCRAALIWRRATAMGCDGGQLREMEATAADTKDAIRVSGRLADAAEETARYARDTFKLTQDNFKIEVRPYIWLAKRQGAPEFGPENGVIMWNWWTANYGKLPALNVRFSTAMKLGSGEFEGDPRPWIGAPLNPNDEHFATVYSHPGIKRREFEELMNADRGITIRGTISYSDVLGGEYETIFCLFHSRGGATAHCEDGNGMK